MLIKYSTEFFKKSITYDRVAAYEIYTSFAAITQSRFFSGDQLTTKTLVPNIFDRVFCTYIHIGNLPISEQTVTDVEHSFGPSSSVDSSELFHKLDASPASPNGIYVLQTDAVENPNSIVNDLNVQVYVECTTLQAKST